MMKAILVHNRSAGVRDCTAEELVGAVREAGVFPTYVSAGDGDLAAALEESADLVVVAGGDGTVAKVATILPGRGIPFTILPMGTMNNIATALGIVGSPDRLARGWRTGERRRFDVWVAEGPWGRRRFVEGVGLGALARTVSEVEDDAPKRRRGQDGREALRNALAAADLGRWSGFVVDGVELAGEWLLVEALNIAYAGPSLELAPDADPSDGMLDLMCLDAERCAEALDWLEVAEGRGPAPATVRQCRKVQFDWHGGPLRIDDTEPDRASGTSGRVELSLEAAPLTVLIPGKSV
jgi:diacylglycerol kinase family enzyme